MKIVKLSLLIFFLLPTIRAQQAPHSATTHQLTAMLNQFLDDASKGNRAGFDRFFADDVIYTGSNALVRTKPEIMTNVGSMKPTPDKKTTYSAEDVSVHDFGKRRKSPKSPRQNNFQRKFCCGKFSYLEKTTREWMRCLTASTAV